MLEKIIDNFTKSEKQISFHIEGVDYSYAELRRKVVEIQQLLIAEDFKKNRIVMLYVYDDLETYASILAIWFLGGTVVPVSFNQPSARQTLIEEQVNPSYVVSSNTTDLFERDKCTKQLFTRNLTPSDTEVYLEPIEPQRLMYIIFTSGSTGAPKGVTIHYNNLNSYLRNNSKLWTKANNESRFLQLYDLSFDASIQSYVLPLFLGASIYTVSPKKIKYIDTLRLLQSKSITFAKISNSVLHYLQPYFDKIALPDLRYCLYAGEGLQLSLIINWKRCTPNTMHFNVYGPTEATVNTHVYPIPDDIKLIKHHNEIVSFGKPFGNNKSYIFNDKGVLQAIMSQGELCLSGEQISPGYWLDEKRNKSSFSINKSTGKRIYRTGDIAFIDHEGDHFFCGRMDEQVKINGFRVEILEVESAASTCIPEVRFKALVDTEPSNTLFLFVEDEDADLETIKSYLIDNLPPYMIPKELIPIKSFPLTISGKIDRIKLLDMYKYRNG